MSKRLIPAAREEDVLHMYWLLLVSLESKCAEDSIIDKDLITASYQMLNDIGYTKLRPRWEERKP